jgi:thymidylate synthase (FAD)
MKIIKPSIEIISEINSEQIMKHIENAGRTCYKSHDKTNEKSAVKFIQSIINRGHESVLEHFSISVKIICDRGIMAEITRHRLCSFSVESSRYCNYSKDKFNNELTFIKPCFWNEDEIQTENENSCFIENKFDVWKIVMKNIEKAYFMLLEKGATPQEARSILPNSLKTEIFMTANLREWRHILKLRTSEFAHPQCIEVMSMVLKEFKLKLPIVFHDIKEDQP